MAVAGILRELCACLDSCDIQRENYLWFSLWGEMIGRLHRVKEQVIKADRFQFCLTIPSIENSKNCRTQLSLSITEYSLQITRLYEI